MEMAAASGTGLGVSDSSSSRITGLSAYVLGGCLTCSDGEPGRTPGVPWPSSGFELRWLPLCVMNCHS